MKPTPLLQLSSIAKSFGKTRVLQSTDLSVDHGEFLALLGPSGSGKTTLLRVIAGLEAAEAGDILINGESCRQQPPQGRGVGMVFQDFSTYPHFTVEENLSYPLRLRRISRSEIKLAVAEMAARLEISHLLARQGNQISGGEAKRVAIGRALIGKPRLLLLDEPFNGLDAALRDRLRPEIARLLRDLRVTAVFVTHDQDEATSFADRMAIMNQGRIEQIGRVEEVYRSPVSTFVAQFFGRPSMNFFYGAVTVSESGTSFVTSTRDLQLDVPHNWAFSKGTTNVTLGIRPEHWQIGNGDQSIGATVRYIEHRTWGAILYCSTMAGSIITVQTSSSDKLPPNVNIDLTPKPNGMHFFDESGRRMFQKHEEAPA